MNKTTDATWEIVLPNGSFARVRPIVFGDMMVAQAAGKFALVALVAQICTIDGKAHPMDEWLTMDWETIAPIIAEVGRRLEQAGANKGVA